MVIADCNACGMKNITVEQIRVDGIDINICVNFQTCNKRTRQQEQKGSNNHVPAPCAEEVQRR